MKLSIKKYINDTVKKEAKIGYDKSVKSWYGILHHQTGDIYSQRKTRTAVKKELAEILEESIAFYFEKGKKSRNYEIKTPQIQRAYR